MSTKYVDFQTIKENVSIEHAADMLGLKLKPAGNQLRGICPTCNGDKRSLVITPAKQAFFCFKGNAGGDCISLVAHVRGLPVRDAAHFLSGNGTVPVSGTSSPTAPQKEKGRPNAPAFDPESYAKGLNVEHEALDAFGLNSEVCARWRCGIASKGVLRGRLALPVCDPTGTIVAFIGRALDQPHYAFPNGFAAADHIFGADRLEPGEVRIVSDPVQVITAYENGVQAVAFLTDTILTTATRNTRVRLGHKTMRAGVLSPSNIGAP